MINCLDTSLFVLIATMIVVGITIFSVLAIEVFGHKGGNQNKKIEEVIARFGG